MAVWRIIFVWIIFWMIVWKTVWTIVWKIVWMTVWTIVWKITWKFVWTIVWTIVWMLRQLFGKVGPWTLWVTQSCFNPASFIIKVDLILFYFQFKKAKKVCFIDFLVMDCTTIGFSFWKCTVGIFQICIQIMNKEIINFSHSW